MLLSHILSTSDGTCETPGLGAVGFFVCHTRYSGDVGAYGSSIILVIYAIISEGIDGVVTGGKVIEHAVAFCGSVGGNPAIAFSGVIVVTARSGVDVYKLILGAIFYWELDNFINITSCIQEITTSIFSELDFLGVGVICLVPSRIFK